MTRFVIFDLDGTLLDTRRDIAAAVNAGLTANGLPAITEAQVVSFVGDGLGRLIDRSVAAAAGRPEQAESVAAHWRAYYAENATVHTVPYPGIDQVLDALRALPLAIASNKPTDPCHLVLRHFGWQDRFRHVFGGDWGGAKKPSPAPLLDLCARLGVDPADGVMVGDSPVDIQAGRAAGMRTVAALYGYKSAEALRAESPDAAVTQASDLLAAILRP